MSYYYSIGYNTNQQQLQHIFRFAMALLPRGSVAGILEQLQDPQTLDRL